MNSDNDLIVVESVIKGCSKDFMILVMKYQSRLEGFVTKFFRSTTNTGDIVQETFLIAYRDLAKLRNRERFKSWLFGIAYRQCLLFSRKASSEMKGLQKVLRESEASYTIIEEVDCEKEKSTGIELLNKLSELDSLLVWLHYIEEIPYQEIAEMVEMNDATIRQRCRRALMQMREIVK